ncbi:hypothetical protein [Methanothermococcus okinawensis]|uniref:Uncharacterized protein n=1 Tax=Methanothermococcus okinawensis (strain DSM 14208 / JCM 11175 / IH1) TaxID=647113 RepID=F8AL16_METOI|nr:hypothetical protein [Methanothermococcus okinawensis]AEH06451.1 hypothetical protein Metok_0469 [Methanothermococcus okinawensis IH1]
MKLNLLKGFAAIAMLCMVGAVFATPVALGDIGGALYGYCAAADNANNHPIVHGAKAGFEVGVGTAALYAGIVGAGIATGGTFWVCLGIAM